MPLSYAQTAARDELQSVVQDLRRNLKDKSAQLASLEKKAALLERAQEQVELLFAELSAMEAGHKQLQTDYSLLLA